MQQRVTWILITNTTQALIYQVKKNIEKEDHKECTLIHDLSHEESRLKSQELSADKMGHYAVHGGPSHGKYAPTTDPHEKEQKKFANQLANFLNLAYKRHQFKALIICAERHFQGLLGQKLSEEVKSEMTQKIEKDYLPLPKAELEKIIEAMVKDYVKV